MNATKPSQAANGKHWISRDDLARLWHHLCNDNQEHVIGFLKDKGFGGTPKYTAARNKTLANSISEGLDCVFAGAHYPFAPVAYPFNIRSQEGRWLCLDIDCHPQGERRSGETLADWHARVRFRGREQHVKWLTGKAWHWLAERVESPRSEIGCGIFEQSGRGVHIWAISSQFRSLNSWQRFLRAWMRDLGIDPVKDEFEVMPSTLVSRTSNRSKFDHGVRLPGSANPKTWNPATGSYLCSRIVEHAGLIAFIKALPELKLRADAMAGQATVGLQDDLWLVSLREQTAITQPRTRHNQLKALISQGVWQIGERKLIRMAGDQYQESSVEMEADGEQHLAEARTMIRKWKPEVIEVLSPAERQAYEKLRPKTMDRPAFLICAAFARQAVKANRKDFPLSTKLLANRVGAAGWESGKRIRNKFEKLGWLTKTQNCSGPRAACFTWNLLSAA